jgi:hypothetical protein
MNELLQWSIAKEADASNNLWLCEISGDDSDTDYAQGLYEAYGVVVNKIKEAVNGTD